MAGVNLWLLTAKDVQEPPFHYANVFLSFIVAAKTCEEARKLAALDAVNYYSPSEVWLDDAMTDCGALAPAEPGIIAAETSVRNIVMVDEKKAGAAASHEAAAVHTRAAAGRKS